MRRLQFFVCAGALCYMGFLEILYECYPFRLTDGEVC